MLESILEPRTWETEIAGVPFRFREFSGYEVRRYLASLERLQSRCLHLAAELEDATLSQVAEIAMAEEDGFFAGLLQSACAQPDVVTTEWVAARVLPSIRSQILAGIDVLNGMEERVGNWQRLREGALVSKILGAKSQTSQQPDTE